MDVSRKRVAVLGGGICGLSAAYWLRRESPGCDVVVFDAATRCGGVIGTLRSEGCMIETGPLAFPASAPGTAALLAAAGHGDLAVRAAPTQGAGIWLGDRIAPLERTAAGVLRARLLPAAGLARLALEPFLPASRDDDESVRDFFLRRTGEAFLDAVMEPFCASIQAGDPARLGMEANFPGLRAWERRPGRMAWGLWKRERSARRAPAPLLASGPEGNGGVIADLAGALAESGVIFRLGARVDAVIPQGAEGFLIRAGGRADGFDGIVSCLRARDLADAFPAAPSELGAFLEGVPYASVALAYSTLPAESLRGGFTGAHCLVPARSGLGIMSLSIPSRMRAGCCPDGGALIRVSLGGARDPEAAALRDAALHYRAASAIRALLARDALPAPIACVRQRASLPQLGVGHGARLARARERLARDLPRFILSGTGACGAGIEKAAQEGRRAALEWAGRFAGGPA